MVQKITFLLVLSLFAISSMAGVVFTTTQKVSFQRQRYQVSVEFPLEGEAEAVGSIRNWINDVVGVEGEQASDERTFCHVLERSYQDYLETNLEGSRHIEIYRAYEDENCVTFESAITDQDSVVWKTCDCATFSKKDGHRLKINEIFNCSEERIKQLMWEWRGDLPVEVASANDLIVGEVGFIDGWIVVIGPARNYTGAPFRIRYQAAEPFLLGSKRGGYYHDAHTKSSRK